MDTPAVSTYRLATPTGRHIRTATQVTFPGGQVVRFTERIPKRSALAQASQRLDS